MTKWGESGKYNFLLHILLELMKGNEIENFI